VKCIVKGRVKRGSSNNSRWLVENCGEFYTTLISNDNSPLLWDVVNINSKDLETAGIKEKKKEKVIVKIIELVEKGPKRKSRWRIQYRRIKYTCLIDIAFNLRKGDLILVNKGDLE
jgi:hypothetical protein